LSASRKNRGWFATIRAMISRFWTVMPLSEQEFQDRARQVRLLVLDVDGVLADGGIIIDSEGDEIKRFYVRDGFAMRVWKDSGRKLAIISGRESGPVSHRALALAVDYLIEGAADKTPAFRGLLLNTGYSPNEVAVMGDDLPDLPLILSAGLGTAPSDACDEVLDRVDWIVEERGGQGAVRELIEEILRANEEWDSLVAKYNTPAV
jgi:3-deoxy-D-manno-octulosonate 8-phosphate phosphatase (KDO 8-P phosphatase)